MRLLEPFFARHAVEVAKDLIGKKLIFKAFSGIITETEAYRGKDDPASHAFSGITKRSKIMFGPPGYAYVYMIYGMYYCLNIVTEVAGSPSAVLIRGVQTVSLHLNGPGKLCRHFGITTEENALNTLENQDLYLSEGMNGLEPIATTRIGIKKGQEKKWRFLMPKDNVAGILHQANL